MNHNGTHATSGTITVHVNGQSLAIPAGSSLRQALDHLAARPEADEPGTIATALNGQHIARGLREQTLLADGDHITTFEPITGG